MYGWGELLAVGVIAVLCFAYVGYKLFVRRGCSCGKKGGCGGADGTIAERPDACGQPDCCDKRK